MKTNYGNIGFIGAGRITNIILHAWNNTKLDLGKIVVYDVSIDKAEFLSKKYQDFNVAQTFESLVENCQVLFLALHPPVFSEVLPSIKSIIKDNTFIISLSPKITVTKIYELLDKQVPVARVIPNAPSVIGTGYNAYHISNKVDSTIENILKELFLPLGKFKKVEENMLESYATITGMGLTYLWFLFNEFYLLALNTGMTDEQAKEAVNEMIKGASETLFNSGLDYEQTLNLIPSYPFKANEETIKKLYHSSIISLYQKLKV